MTRSLSRRDALKTIARACGAVAVTPMLNLGRFPLFPGAPDYSARAIRLVQDALVIDMLSPLSLNFPLFAKWEAQPELFGAAEFAKYRESGINVFHIAVGTGGLDPR